MPNVSLEPAATEVTLEDLFSDIKRGIYVVGRGVSSIDQQRYNFQFGGQLFFEIRGGKVVGMLNDVAYQANGRGHVASGHCPSLRPLRRLLCDLAR